MMLHTGNKLITVTSELAHFHGADKLRWLGSWCCKSEKRPRGAANWRHTLTSARLFTRLTAASYLKWTSHLSHDKVSLFYCRPEPWPAAHESESWCLNWNVPSSTVQGLLILLASFVLNVFVFISSLEKKTKQAAANPGELVFERRLNLLQIYINVFWNENILFISSVYFNHIWFLPYLALAFICMSRSNLTKTESTVFKADDVWKSFSCCSGVLRCWSQRAAESDHPVAADSGRPRWLVRKGVQLHWNPAELLQGGPLCAAGVQRCRNDPVSAHNTAQASFTTTWSSSQTDLISVSWWFRLFSLLLA